MSENILNFMLSEVTIKVKETVDKKNKKRYELPILPLKCVFCGNPEKKDLKRDGYMNIDVGICKWGPDIIRCNKKHKNEEFQKIHEMMNDYLKNLKHNMDFASSETWMGIGKHESNHIISRILKSLQFGHILFGSTEVEMTKQGKQTLLGDTSEYRAKSVTIGIILVNNEVANELYANAESLPGLIDRSNSQYSLREYIEKYPAIAKDSSISMVFKMGDSSSYEGPFILNGHHI